MNALSLEILTATPLFVIATDDSRLQNYCLIFSTIVTNGHFRFNDIVTLIRVLANPLLLYSLVIFKRFSLAILSDSLFARSCIFSLRRLSASASRYCVRAHCVWVCVYPTRSYETRSTRLYAVRLFRQCVSESFWNCYIDKKRSNIGEKWKTRKDKIAHLSRRFWWTFVWHNVTFEKKKSFSVSLGDISKRTDVHLLDSFSLPTILALKRAERK